MDRDEVISIIKAHATELKSLGVRHLSVFGSVARSEATAESDVDIAVVLAPGARGLARLGRLDAVQLRLSDLLGCSVDVIEEPGRSARIRRAIEREGVRAF